MNEILETINNVGGCDGDSEYDKGWDAAIGEVYRVVEAMEYYLPEWIPVEERLPDGGEDVLVCTGNGWILVAWYGINKQSWHITPTGITHDDIIAWMSLPEPYKPEALREAGDEAGQDAAEQVLQSAT